MKEFIEKLIERMQGVFCDGCTSCRVNQCDGVDKEECSWMVKIKESINQLAEGYKGGWIPCSERLPEKNGYYLVTQKRYSLDTHRVIRIETDYVQFEDGKWGRARHFEIIAWQPLPAPYKEGCE